MIRPGLMRDVVRILENNRSFVVEDFQLTEYASSKGDPCLKIEYRYEPSLSFRFHVPTSRSKKNDYGGTAYYFVCTARPGEQSAEESFSAEGRDGLLTEVKAWLERVEEDLVSVPVVRRLDAHTSMLDQLRERLDAIPAEHLSRDEANQFRDLGSVAKGIH